MNAANRVNTESGSKSSQSFHPAIHESAAKTRKGLEAGSKAGSMTDGRTAERESGRIAAGGAKGPAGGTTHPASGEQKAEPDQGVWKAHWIWSAGEASPRNEWRCFRRTFRLSESQRFERVVMSITADSRYVLFVDGRTVGRGPVRSWPFELAYDEYEIGHLLKPDCEHTIAVLVMHYGVPTFQYLRGRGGLLAQVEGIGGGQRELLLATDSTWETAVHAGYDSRSSRMSCQLAFTEVIDSRQWDDTWKTAGATAALNADRTSGAQAETAVQADEAGKPNPGSSGAVWEHATVIGPAGTEPWTKLVKRDIPYLTEEPVYPVRVERLAKVKPRSWGAVLDLRNHFVPESEHHADNVQFYGFLATVIRVERPVRATIGIVDGGRLSGGCGVNGVWHSESEFYGSQPERYLDIELSQGDNFLLVEVRGTSHGHGYHIGVDCPEPFELRSPLAQAGQDQSEGTVFAALGPFDAVDFVNHHPRRKLNDRHPDYERAKQIASASELAEFAAWLRPVAPRYVSRDDVFSACVWKKSSSLSIPYQLQNAVIANTEPAPVPLFAGFDTEMIIDFGKQRSGYLEFEVEAPEGTVIDFYGFEYMKEDWIQHTYSLDNTLRYICREGRQFYASPVRRGFRFLMVTVRNASGPVRLFRLSMRQSHFPVAEIGRFQCSDPLLNQIWEISKHTTKMCMEDTFVDCPAYEQTFWVGDARNEALINYYLFGDEAIVKRCLRLVPGSSFQSPLYADQVPSGWNSVIPNWTFFWAIACKELFLYGGDRDFAAKLLPHIRYTLDHYWEKRDERGLLHIRSWNLLDWAPIDQPNDGVVTHQNMFFVRALRSAAELAEWSGCGGSEELLARADALKEAINAHLWSEERQAYVDCIHADGRVSDIFSMQTQVVAHLCEIPQGERLERIASYLVQPPAGFVQIGSPFMSFFYYESLAKMGRIDLLLADLRANYGTMIEHDATTCWEMYPKPLSRRSHPNVLTRSHCHAWSAAPGYFLGACVLGVRGADPGWSKVLVEPQTANLSWARGTVPLPGGGRIDVAWRVEANSNRIFIRAEAPSSVELAIKAPEGYEAVIEQVALETIGRI